MSDALRRELLEIFVGRATRRYGLSAINQLQHALQAAALARRGSLLMRRFREEMKSGGEMTGIEFGDPIKPFAAIWIHATGFNAMTYQSLLAPLGLRARIGALEHGAEREARIAQRLDILHHLGRISFRKLQLSSPSHELRLDSSSSG